MKKFTAILLGMVMIFTMAASTAEASSTESSSEAAPAAEATAWVLAADIWGSGVPILDAMNEASLYAIDIAGCDVVNASDDYSADVAVQNIQRFIGNEVDGGNLYLASPATVPTVSDMMKDAEIPFSLHTGIGTADQFEELQANPFFAGAVDANNVLAGEVNAQLAYDQGCRTAVLIGGNVGDSNHDERSQGFRKRFEELGGKVLDEARCSDASEATTKAGDMLSANRDADCVFAFVGDYVPGSLTAKEQLGLDDLKIYVANVDADSAELIKDGTIQGGTDGTTMPPMIGAAIIVNYLDGTPLFDADGKAAHFQTTPIAVDQENVDLYIEVFCTEGRMPIADSLFQSMMTRFNPDCDYESFSKIISEGLTLEALAEAHGIEVK